MGSWGIQSRLGLPLLQCPLNRCHFIKPGNTLPGFSDPAKAPPNLGVGCFSLNRIRDHPESGCDIAILNDLYLTPVPSPVLGRRRLGAADIFHNCCQECYSKNPHPKGWGYRDEARWRGLRKKTDF